MCHGDRGGEGDSKCINHSNTNLDSFMWNKYFLLYESSKISAEKSRSAKANIKNIICLMNIEGYQIQWVG